MRQIQLVHLISKSLCPQIRSMGDEVLLAFPSLPRVLRLVPYPYLAEKTVT